ncbi:hypothetical protein HOLleu_00418 [Holothuria leucospilota]|uniref:Uncharacterized protein n=1 Tax=Holothuria leucospilota TaxID=206669 RepID=A0A9Q1CNY8_HOLLE|nr:hypothetical protein HOLleu_00418 [Holothuria leucospilota]
MSNVVCVSNFKDRFYHAIADKSYLPKLITIRKELEMVDNELDQISNSLKAAVIECHTEADAIKTTISEAAQSIIDLVKRREQELHLRVDQKKADVMKQIEKSESRKMEFSLSSDNVRGACDQLTADLVKQDFRRTAAIESLSGRSVILQREVNELALALHTGEMDLSFERAPLPDAIPVGCLRDNIQRKTLLGSVCGSRKGKRDSLIRLHVIDCKYTIYPSLCSVEPYYCYYRVEPYYYRGFSLLTVNTMVKAFQQHRNLYLVCMEGRSVLKHSICVAEESTTMLPIGGHGGTNFLFYNTSTIFKYNIDPSLPNKERLASLTLSDALLYAIRAVCWDEEMTNCYALLQDGLTIKFFSFDSGRNLSK